VAKEKQGEIRVKKKTEEDLGWGTLPRHYGLKTYSYH
jgi:hypothetical protein